MLDSSGWIEFFTGRSLADRNAIYLAPRHQLITPTIVLYEVYKKIKREWDEETALLFSAPLTATQVVQLTQPIALPAADLSLLRMRAMRFFSVVISVILISGTLGFVVGAPDVFAGTNVTICHIPPRNPDNKHTIELSENAVPGHLAHGDTIGPCDSPPPTCNPTECDDNNECTADFCSDAVCDYSPNTGASCGTDGVCDDSGTCVEIPPPPTCEESCEEIALEICGDDPDCFESEFFECVQSCQPPPPACDQVCSDEATEMFSTCLGDGTDERVCLIDSQAFLIACVFPACIDPGLSCENQCLFEGSEFYLLCLTDPADFTVEQCASDTETFVLACLDACSAPPPPPTCEEGCYSDYEACLAEPDTEVCEENLNLCLGFCTP